MASQILSRVLRIVTNPHFWVVVALFAIGIILHYPQQILSTSSPSLFLFLGLSRHAIERIFFLLPLTYVGFFFGLKAGLASLAVALGIMLPRVFLISLYSPDALLETSGIIIIGGLVNLGFEGYRREQSHRQQVLSKLEAAQQVLQAQVRVIESNEKRLSALNEVSAIVSQSLELEDVLNAAADKVSEVMGVEVVLVFLLEEESQELELKTYRGVSEKFVAGLKGLKVGEGFNGRVAQTGEPLLVEDASQDPRLTREVVKQEKIQAELIVPLKAKGKVLGTLSVAMRGPRQFLTEEIELLSHVANHIGVAVENARLYRKEHTMAERIASDVIREKRLQENLRFYLQQVTRAQEEERKRIARELHDDTAQELVALSRRLDSFTSNASHLSAQDLSYLEELRQQTDGILDVVRRFGQDLRPSVLDDLGLLPALEWLTSDLAQHFGIDIAIGVVGSSRRFPPETEVTLFRIAQEALRNVWKHSEASRAWVAVEFGDDKTILTITDNGKGFELPERIEDLASVGKLGLAGMQERAQLIGGRLTLQSEPGKGTTVTVEVPG
ncbi:MAG: GAF domain-containing protein [Dehalococcoidales bacterium]